MASPNLFLVVMAGGSGTRFWPKSTSKKPKQLLTFGTTPEAKSILAQTLDRFTGLAPKTQQIIVTTRLLKQAVEDQASGAVVLAEPQGRNTAPCIYWAAREVAAKDPKGIMMIMPSDHYIPLLDSFRATVQAAASWAATHDDLVTLGVKPSRPETGYGYLRVNKTPEKAGCFKVEAFVEKPNEEKARQFVEAGNYLWNGGMFVWRAEVILEAFDRFMPEMAKAWDSSAGNIDQAYPKMTATSIDYGIMEKASNVVSFPLECGWDDLGSWISLEGLADALHARKDGNVITGGELIAVQAEGNIVDANGKLVTLLGVKDLVVVEHGNAILVADKNRAQDIRLIVEQVKKIRPEMA